LHASSGEAARVLQLYHRRITVPALHVRTIAPASDRVRACVQDALVRRVRCRFACRSLRRERRAQTRTFSHIIRPSWAVRRHRHGACLDTRIGSARVCGSVLIGAGLTCSRIVHAARITSGGTIHRAAGSPAPGRPARSPDATLGYIRSAVVDRTGLIRGSSACNHQPDKHAHRATHVVSVSRHCGVAA
jgi:hypothetical protein